jgi:CelD/BcsL family acetyltransferase involved in cellulose biosynthesis
MNDATNTLRLVSVAVTTEVIRTNDGFDALQLEWHQLLDECGISPFQSFEYQRAWWKHFGETNPNAGLHIIVVRDDGRVIGIAPLFIEKVRVLGPITYTRLAFIGRGISDYLDLLTARGYEDLCVDRIVPCLAEVLRVVDVTILEDVAERSCAHAFLHGLLHKARLPGSLFISDQCPRTGLRDTWDATLESFQVVHRKEIRRRRRNLSKNFTVDFETTSSEADVARDMDELIGMHQERWTKTGHTGVFADPRAVALHREIAPVFFRRGWLFLAFLRVNGNRVVGNYGYVFRDELMMFIGGAAEPGDIRKFSPGRVLTGYCMEEAARRGMKAYDFLRGTEQYKYEFDAVDAPNWTFLSYNTRWTTWARTKFKLDLLIRAIARRTNVEAMGLRQVASRHGIFSLETLKYVPKRSVRYISDGTRKLLAPERSVRQVASLKDQDKQNGIL